MKIEFRVTKNGFNQVARLLEVAPHDVTDNVIDAALHEAQRVAPVDTGHLVDNLKKNRVDANTAELQSNADYSGYVEYGTRHMAAQPFMGPAALAGEQELQREVRRLKRDAEQA